MPSTTKFAVMSESLEFLSKEWAFAKLRPNNSTDTIGPQTENTDGKPVNSKPSREITVATAPKSIVQPSSTKTGSTPPTIPVPELILPSESNPYDPKEFYKTGCIMAMLLGEQTAPAPTKPTSGRELIVTTKTPWKLGDEETERARKAAHREWEKSGAAACAGLAASRWYKAGGEKPVAPKPTCALSRRVSHKSRNDPAACSGLAASRWYGAAKHSRG